MLVEGYNTEEGRLAYERGNNIRDPAQVGVN